MLLPYHGVVLLFVKVSCNRRYIICITSDGNCWQFNIESREWRDLSAVLFTQIDEDGMAHDTMIKVCCGETLTALLTNRGDVYNIPNKLSLPGIKVVDIACGRSHIIMLTHRGEVYSVGEGSRGQLGHGELEGEEEPRLVEGLAGLEVIAVACGGWHSCAITADHDLYTWGWDSYGQLALGGGDLKNKALVQAVPHVVNWPIETEVTVMRVACGARHTVALLDDSSVWGCGWNKYGQLALPGVESVNCMTRLPSGAEKFRDVVCGPWNTCLVT